MIVTISLLPHYRYLLLHHDPGDGSLDHVGPVQAVHAVDSEDAFLLTDDSSLIHPETEDKKDVID